MEDIPVSARAGQQTGAPRCCCYDHGNCILLDDGEPHCCVQIISRSGIYCNYLRRAVLPSDSELYAQIRDQNK